MVKRLKKAEAFRFGINGIPHEIKDRIVIPDNIKAEGHPLNLYVKTELIPSDLDLILLEDLDGFYKRLSRSEFPFLMPTCRGLYVAKDHVYSKGYKAVNNALKKEYGIKVERGLLLPQNRVDYWTMIHEALHDVFNNLSSEKRYKLVQSAIDSYNSSDRLNDVLDLTHLNISNFAWDVAETAKIQERNRREGISLLDNFDNFYTFGNLKSFDQLIVVDEVISNFYANNRVHDRWSQRYLSHQFRATLRDIGYNMENPPKVENQSFSPNILFY
ncbi:hypothetical protein J4476_01910 [Candidatus Woesearchaeota archaeon]|nr:MAG: hypothetical protein QT09_C0016G0024 [archaeon GW2011_AR18]MBS3161429.1 hypothetical protein [Candidatus Woesearchaeota archaeon]HIH25588.1 hypothetical protein [Nanoarchaeota archaeon]